METREAWVVMLALLASPGGAFAQEPVDAPETASEEVSQPTLGWTGVHGVVGAM